jgi:ketosteroid isomerase-like protein
MKYVPLVLALAIAGTPVVYTQAPDKKTAPSAAAKSGDAGAEQTLMKIERDAAAALIKRDVAAFGKVFADDAIMITPDGMTQTKAQLLADLKSGDLVIEASDISDMKVRVHGDSAVVTYITTDKGKFKGQDISGRYRWTDVFVRHNNGPWQVIAGQGTPIQAPAK